MVGINLVSPIAASARRDYLHSTVASVDASMRLKMA